MKKIKENKGITLVALIITIIVLLILAVVAISAVQGDGIIAHAKNARDNYQTAQSEENITLGDYINQINDATESSENSEENSQNGGENPSIVEGTIWSNIKVSSILEQPIGNNNKVWEMQLTDESNNTLIYISYSPYFLNSNDGIGNFQIGIGSNYYVYVWQDIDVTDVEAGHIVLNSGWNVSNNDMEDISNIKLSGKIRLNVGDKVYTVPDYFAKWFIQE